VLRTWKAGDVLAQQRGVQHHAARAARQVLAECAVEPERRHLSIPVRGDGSIMVVDEARIVEVDEHQRTARALEVPQSITQPAGEQQPHTARRPRQTRHQCTQLGDRHPLVEAIHHQHHPAAVRPQLLRRHADEQLAEPGSGRAYGLRSRGNRLSIWLASAPAITRGSARSPCWVLTKWQNTSSRAASHCAAQLVTVAVFPIPDRPISATRRSTPSPSRSPASSSRTPCRPVNP
jgi:hypothetical protein